MSRKDSRSSKIEDIPQIVYLFQDAHKIVFGTEVFVRGSKNIERFRRLEKRLQSEEIPLTSYTKNCMLMLKDWMNKREFKTVPLTVLTGDWLYGKYKKLRSQTSVKLLHKNDDKIEDIMYQDEYTVSLAYIEANLRGNIRMMEVVDEIEDVLSEEWKKEYYSGKLRKYETIVLMDLEEQYNVSAYSLHNLVNTLKNSGNYR